MPVPSQKAGPGRGPVPGRVSIGRGPEALARALGELPRPGRAGLRDHVTGSLGSSWAGPGPGAAGPCCGHVPQGRVGWTHPSEKAHKPRCFRSEQEHSLSAYCLSALGQHLQVFSFTISNSLLVLTLQMRTGVGLGGWRVARKEQSWGLNWEAGSGGRSNCFFQLTCSFSHHIPMKSL